MTQHQHPLVRAGTARSVVEKARKEGSCRALYGA
jgi:hypothetical protein